MRQILFTTIAILLFFTVQPIQGQQKEQTHLTVATYNLYNLFDTINDPGIRDGILEPDAYKIKLENLARIIGALSTDILALSEIENADVLRDLIATAPLADKPYGIVHYDSPDHRGIDVALLYRTDRVEMLNSEPITTNKYYATRDVLRVEFAVHGADQKLAIYAVHLPSRRGGSSKAARMRELISANIADMTTKEHEDMGVMVLGDFNDNPTSRLIQSHFAHLHCATTNPHRKGIGSYAWRDTWLMYDNILTSKNLALIGDARIFRQDWMVTQSGRWRGYPNRDVASDHFPVYIRIYPSKKGFSIKP